MPSLNEHHRRLRRCFSTQSITTAVFAAERASPLACSTKQTPTHTQAAPCCQQPRYLLLPTYYGPLVFPVWHEKERPRNSKAVNCSAVTWPTCLAGRRLSSKSLALQACLLASAVQTDIPALALTTWQSASAAAWPCARDIPPFAKSKPRPVHRDSSRAYHDRTPLQAQPEAGFNKFVVSPAD